LQNFLQLEFPGTEVYMQRRNLLAVTATFAFVALTGCATERLSSTTGSIVVEGISARSARELARTRGLINRKQLPANLRRLMQEGQPLPDSVPVQELPASFTGELPAVAAHEWRAAGTDLLLVNTQTRVIARILRGPLR
jgi:hypothetical protein